MTRNGAIGKRRIFGKPGIIAATSEASSIAIWRLFYYRLLRLTNQFVFRPGLSLQSVGSSSLRRTPLSMRELMAYFCTFNDIYRGIPLIRCYGVPFALDAH